MNMKLRYKNKAGLLLTTAAVALTLGACTSNQGGVTENIKHPTEVTHEGTPIEGATLKYALVSNAPFKGILIDELSVDSTDSEVNGFVDTGIFGWDENRQLDDSGLASIEFDVEGKTATVTLNSKDYKWSDGEPLTIDDYIFAYTSIGDAEYTGARYNDNYENVVGMVEYHNGEADKVSGLEKLDDYSMKIHFKEMAPSLQLAGGGVSNYIMPKHIFENIPKADWETSEYVRSEKTVGAGPYKIEKIINGESVTYVANEHYFKGEPKTKRVVLDVVSSENIVSEMKAGHYDLATMPSSQYETYKDLKNVTLVSSLANSYEYVAFHMGKFNPETGLNEYNPNSKMANKNLRQAMGYALDIDTAGESLYNGLLHRSNSLIVPFFKDVNDPDLVGFNYDPEKSKKLLADAGYKDTDGDGLVEDPDGEKLTINFAARTRDDANEGLVQDYLQKWHEVGLDVQLYTGRTLEVNSFYDKIQADDPEIDVYAGGWSTGYDPDPTGLYSESAQFNFTRFVDAKNTELLGKISSVEAFDKEKQKEFYKEWQNYAFDEAFAIPTLTGESITAVNKRVKFYTTDLSSSSKSALHLIELTADEPVAE
ncbi:peptide/nickel transport system substrate-binding protein [Granulicatella balaenopterae]|uniref:Peptide/nickel transport system substrate-binding protein n=1 Tax=Granulicatella balaenopterae TaxID=137733 RepID=A0A1H9H830_9LACT|nr:oligopeptide ABC transporter substrate-binding protein [Granulicatella balaenopterae]SEQ58388.1 peptide/nickel transport system substrate-binding protein [Granulicatella balaenopterae]